MSAEMENTHEEEEEEEERQPFQLQQL